MRIPKDLELDSQNKSRLLSRKAARQILRRQRREDTIRLGRYVKELVDRDEYPDPMYETYPRLT